MFCLLKRPLLFIKSALAGIKPAIKTTEDKMPEKQEWILCPQPRAGDILKWNEPLWAAPNKPRGKPDKIGEQQIEAQLLVEGDTLELRVLSVQKLSGGSEALLKVKTGDNIRRKKTTLAQGQCHKKTG